VLQETDNGVGLAGIAYRARLMPLKACYGYWEMQIVQSELGIPGLVDPSERGTCPDSAVSQAIRYAAGRGVFVAISNGNQYGRGNPVEYPAAYAPDLEGAVSVGAVGRSGRRAYYSATGAHVELAAPGGDSRDGGLAGVLYQVGLDTRQRTRRGQQPARWTTAATSRFRIPEGSGADASEPFACTAPRRRRAAHNASSVRPYSMKGAKSSAL